MPVRLQPFPTDWKGGYQAAAELAVEAGRAKGQGIAALGAGIGGGLQALGAGMERKQTRADAKAERSEANERWAYQQDQENTKTRFSMTVSAAAALAAAKEQAIERNMMTMDPDAALAAASAEFDPMLQQAASAVAGFQSQVKDYDAWKAERGVTSAVWQKPTGYG